MLGESKILLDDQRCSSKNNLKSHQGTLYHVFIPFFFHIAQCVVCAKPHKLLVPNTSEAMGIGRNLPCEKIAQAVALDNFNYCQRNIRRILGCSKSALQKNVKKYTDKRDILKISLVEGTPCHNCSQRNSYHKII